MHKADTHRHAHSSLQVTKGDHWGLTVDPAFGRPTYPLLSRLSVVCNTTSTRCSSGSKKVERKGGTHTCNARAVLYPSRSGCPSQTTTLNLTPCENKNQGEKTGESATFGGQIMYSRTKNKDEKSGNMRQFQVKNLSSPDALRPPRCT